MTGYEALRDGAAWLDLSSRGKIKLTGEDRARLLHAMSTNHIQQLTPGTGCYAFFLNDKGRILADANILCRPGYFLLDVEPEAREKLYQHLDHYIIADDVTLEDVTDQTATLAVEGAKAAELLARMGVPVPESNFASLEWDSSTLVARLSSTGQPGLFIFAPVAQKQDLIRRLEAAGATSADPEAARIVRLENGKARYGEDIGERFLAQEANQPDALHFSKGCYLGQEIVERVRSRGQIHRVLMPLLLDTDRPPDPGAKLDGAEITSAAYSPALNKVVALAYVKTEHARPGEQLMLGSVRAEVAGRSPTGSECSAPSGSTNSR